MLYCLILHSFIPEEDDGIVGSEDRQEVDIVTESVPDVVHSPRQKRKGNLAVPIEGGLYDGFSQC